MEFEIYLLEALFALDLVLRRPHQPMQVDPRPHLRSMQTPSRFLRLPARYISANLC